MNGLKHIFLTIFALAVCSLSLQGAIVSCLNKDNSFKKQVLNNSIPVSEEEEEDEHEKSKSEEDYVLLDNKENIKYIIGKRLTTVLSKNFSLILHIVTIHTPPPETQL